MFSHVELLANVDGFTVDNHGNPVTSGYALSIYPEYETVIPADADRKQAILDYIDNHQAVLAQDGHCLGGWLDSETGLFYLDVSIVVHDRQQAEHLARQAGQLAFFNLDTFEGVRVAA